jgi:serine phosphatase RsbU (regulator of sigma subunit)
VNEIKLDSVNDDLGALYNEVDKGSSITIELTDFDNQQSNTVRVPSKDIDHFNLENLDSSVIITYVFPDGVSDRAGLRRGDIIYEINGQKFKTVKDADRIVKSSHSGSSIDYLVRRNNRTFSKTLTLPKIGINLSQLLMMLCGIFMLFLGEIIGIKRPRIRGARITSVSLIIFGLVSMLGLVGLNSIDNIFDHFLLIFANLALYFAIPLILHSLKYFPRHLVAMTDKKYLIITPYVFALLFSMLQIGVNYGFLAGVIGEKALLMIVGFGFLSFLILTALFIFITNLIYKKSVQKADWQKGKIIRFVFTFILFIIVFQSVLFQFGYFKLRELIYASLLLIPISYLVTIGLYKVFDLNIRVKRNYQFLLISAALYLGFASLLIFLIYLISLVDWQIPNLHFSGTSIEVLKNPLRPEMHQLYEKILIAFLSLGIAVLLWNVTKIIQEKINLKFYRSKSDFRQAAKEFSKLNSKNFDPEQFSDFFLNRLSEIVQAKRVGLLLFKGDRLIIHKFAGFNDDTLNEYISAVSGKLILSLKNYSDSVPVDYLPDAQRIVLREFKFQYLTPIWSKEELIGIILVGEKLSESAYQNDDLLFLSAIAGQASIAIENSLLYEDLAKQERFKHELEIARGIQLASLPVKTPDIKGLEISASSIPALEVGGDFYDYLNGKANAVTIVIGDVSGKGTSAALYMSKIQGIMRTLHAFDLKPKELLVRTNSLISESMDKKSFVTSISAYVDLDTKTVTVSRAGHLPLYYYNFETDKVEKIMPNGIMLGFGNSSKFESLLEEMKLSFNTGDILLFITDGILETRDSSGVEFDEKEILKMLSIYNNLSAEEIKNNILRRVNSFAAKSEQFDDMTIIVVKKNS